MKTGWIACLIISLIAAFFTILGPIALIFAIISIIMIIRKPKKEPDPIKAQIDLITQQFGIQYGTPEEKLKQLAIIAAKAKNTTDDN